MSNSNIMVVEDSGIVLLDIQKSLISLGYSVVATASSKDDAIRKAEEMRPDLVLMDIRLGEGMGGIDAADYIREHFNIPVVFLTGYADEDTFQRAKITDPFGYILKPFDPKGLRTTIEIALHNHDLKNQLHESEKRYRTLIETMNDGVCQIDVDGKFIFVNDKFCQMTGYAKEQIIGCEHVTLFAKERQELQREEFEKRKTGKANSFETALMRKEGTELPVILSGSPVFDRDGNFAGSIGVLTDISEQTKSEQAMRRRAEEMDALQETILGLTAPNISLQEFLEEIVQRAADLLNASSGGLYVTEPEHSRVRCVVSYNTVRDFTGTLLKYGEGAAGYVAQTGEPLIIDNYRTWSGRANVYESDKPFHAVLSAPLIWQGSVTGVIHLLRDDGSQQFSNNDLRLLMAFADHAAVALENTRLYDSIENELEERKRAEAEVRISKQALEEAERLVHLGHYEIDPVSGKAVWSEEIFNIFGLDPKEDEPTVESYYDLIHPEDRSKLYELYDESVQKGVPFDFVYRILRHDGEIRFVHSNSRTLSDRNGNTIKLFGTLQDITELKQVELALIESEERYRTLFENSPLSIWEEDFSEIQNYFMELHESGITDYRTYFENNMDDVSRLAGMIKFTNFNKASLDLFGVESQEDLPLNLPDYFFEESLGVFREEMIALAEGKIEFHAEIPVCDLTGQHRTFQLDLAVAPAYEQSLARVLVSIIDITERKQAEEIMLARYRLVRKSLSLKLPDLLQATLDEAEILTKSSISFFHLVEADQINLSLQSWSTNTLQNMCMADGFHHPIGEAGVWADCIRERKPIVHNDYESLGHRNGFLEGHAELKRELVVPIIRGENIVAIIGVGNKVAEYSRKDIEIVSLLADLAWDIVERKQTETALRESEAMYHDLVETAQDLIWQCDREGRYVYLNPAWEGVLGYKVEEMLGKPFSDFQTPEDAKRDRQLFEELLEGASLRGYETVHLSKSGRRIHLVFNAKSVLDDHGIAIGTRGTAYDVTDRKRAEDALAKSEYLLRESQKIAHMGHYELDILNGNWESSESLNELFGIDWEYKSDVDGWLMIVHPDDRDEMAAYFTEEVIKNRKNFNKEYRIIRIADGVIRWVHGLGRLEFGQDSNPVRMIGNIQDITERKEAEIAMQESAARYRAVVENQTEFIVRWKPDGMRTFVNDAYLHYYEITPEEAVHQDFLSLVAKEDRGDVKQKVARLMSGESQVETDVHRVIRPDGGMGWHEWTDHVIHNDRGKIVEVQSVGRDITERKQAEEALRESEERMRLLASAAHEGIVFTKEGKVIEANEQLARMLGCELSELIGKSAMEYVAPESRALVLEKIRSGAEGPYEHLSMKKDGTIFPVEVRAQMMTVQGQKMRVSAILDVTERKRTGEMLAQERQRLSNVIEGTNVGTWEWNIQTGETKFNERWAKIIGYSLEEISPVSIETSRKFTHPDDLRQSNELLEKHFNGELDYYECEMRMLHKEGDWVWVLDRGKVAAWTEGGKPLLMSGTYQDITKRKQAELARQESERRFREVLEKVKLVAISTDLKGNITFCNDFLLELVGWTREELLGKNWFETCLPPDIGPEIQAMFRETLEQENVPSYFENEILTKSGELRLIVWNNTMLRDIKGQVIGTSSIGEDITERKHAEEALKARTRELEALFSISSHLRTAQSADEMLPVVLYEMRRVLNSDSNAVILLNADGDHFTYALSDGSLAVNSGEQFDVENSISGRVLRSRQPYTTENFSSDPYKTHKLRGDDNLGPAVFAPVISEAEFLGVLLCARSKEEHVRPFAKSDVQLLIAIGEMVGNALRRARLYDQALTRLQNVQTLHSIDIAISANLDLSVILDVLLSQGTAQLDVDAASILLLNPHTHMLEFAAGNGFRIKEISSAHLRLGEGLPGQAAMERKILHIDNLPEADNLIRRYLLEEGFLSYQAVPLIAKGQLQGVLEIFDRKPILKGEEQISFLETLATQAAIAIDNSQLFSDLQRSNFELEMAYDATIEGWSRALELRDQETEGHTLRVTDMTLHLAKAIGIRSNELIHVRRGALLHDIGKMGVPDRILLKPAKLIDEEWEIMKKHTIYAYEMLRPIEFLRSAIDIPHCHHERWDGTGYPRQLKGEQIPLSARVFAVADVWDALTSERPYRDAWPEEKALEYISTNAGKHFDPKVVEKFLELRDDGSS